MATHNPKHTPVHKSILEHKPVLESHKSNLEHKPKISNAVLAIVSIFAIFLISYFAVTYRANTDMTSIMPVQTGDSAGLATGVLDTQAVSSDVALCKLIIGQTTINDENTMAISLEVGGATYYSGNSISVTAINDNGCQVDVNGNSDYLAIGQIERLGAVYVTVTDIAK